MHNSDLIKDKDNSRRMILNESCNWFFGGKTYKKHIKQLEKSLPPEVKELRELKETVDHSLKRLFCDLVSISTDDRVLEFNASIRKP